MLDRASGCSTRDNSMGVRWGDSGMSVDGIWTSGDVLIRLVESRLQPLSRDLSMSLRPKRMCAEMELVATKLSNGLEIVDRIYTAVLPKKDFHIHIERGGWTGPEMGMRTVTVDIIRSMG